MLFWINEIFSPPDYRHEVSCDQALSPEQRQDARYQEARGQEAGEVVLVLEHDQGVSLQVGHVDCLAGSQDCRVLPEEYVTMESHHTPSSCLYQENTPSPFLPDTEPAHVGKEESPECIVRVSIGLAGLVVEPASGGNHEGELIMVMLLMMVLRMMI